MDPAVEHAAAEGEAAAEPAAVEPAATTATEGEAAPATDHSATTGTEAAAAPAAEHAAPGVAPKGAIFLGPDNHMIHHAHEAPTLVKLSPFIAMILGLLLAFQMYIRRPDLPAKLAAQQRPLYLFLLNKWYFDQVYDFLFVRPAKWLGNFLWKKGDGAIIDGTINGIAMGIIPFFTRLAGRAQSGYIFHYAFAMVIGVTLLIIWMTLSGGAH
jgi:NADH-quinone oxidoreductase subunit L